MNEETFYENVEILDESYTVDTVGSFDSELSDVTGVPDGIENNEQDFLSSGSGVSVRESVSDGNFGTSGSYYYTVDSSGNFVPFSVSGSDAAPEQVQVQNLSTDDFEPYFMAINYRLDTIIFLLISFWCIKKIKIAVANFTGRSLDGRKDGLDR